jgi:hypothetical protein
MKWRGMGAWLLGFGRVGVDQGLDSSNDAGGVKGVGETA